MLSAPRRTRVRRATCKPQSAPNKSLQIRHVLVPVDFSAPSLEAIEFALPLLKQFGADLHIVHVVIPEYTPIAMMPLPLMVLESEPDRHARQHLRAVAAKAGLELGTKNLHVIKGRPFEEICELARETGIDLIVIATRGNTGVQHLMLGSTAERVVRHSPCPVLVVRGGVERNGHRNGDAHRVGFGRIVVPIDFSSCSMRGLDYARALAERFGSTLTLVHSVHLDYYVASEEYARYDFPLLLRQAETAARDQMRALVRETNWGDIKIETVLEAGHPGEEICARAKDHRADLIVTSTHGRTGLRHVFMGSTAEYVVRHAHCPVLVIPSRPRIAINSTRMKP